MKGRSLVLLLVACTATAQAQEEAALRAFTGARTKGVWVQQVEGEGDDPICWADRHVLRALDTDDGRGEFTLLGEVTNYHRPLIAPRGDRVVFSRFSNRKFYVVNWDGAGLRELGDGYGLAAWRDPATGEEWVYFTRTPEKTEWDQHFGHPVRRLKLDDPKTVELVWDRTIITIDNFQLSADGTRACAQFPHPRAGFALLPNRSWTPITRGCWTSMAPDNSYWLWAFDGKHRNITIHDPEEDRAWTVNINSAPGMDGYEVYHPRWSNDRRFMVLTGPYKVGEKGKNLIGEGGRDVELFAGRFSEDYSHIAEWLQITHNGRGDFYPDLWIEQTERPAGVREPEPPRIRRIPETWPLVREGLVFVWDNASRPDDLPGPDGESIRQGPLTGEGRVFWGPHHEMDLSGGRFMSRDDGRLLSALRAARAVTIEALITPATRSAWPAFATEQKLAPVLGYYLADGTALFGLAQDGPQLKIFGTFGKDREETWDAGSLTARCTRHVVMTCEGGRLRAWLDGDRVLDRPFEPASLPAEGLGLLRFGGDAGARHWYGFLESVALYDRGLTKEEIQRHWAWQSRRLADRKPIPFARVRARLVEAPPAPDPLSIAPYRRALSGHVYEIQSVLEGVADTGRVVVACWSVLDGQKVEAGRRPGKVYTLMLEPFEAHPQLESERLLMDAQLLALPLYYETFTPE